MLSAVRRERHGGPDFFISRELNPSQAGALKSDSPKVTRSVVGQTCGTVHVDGRTVQVGHYMRTVHADSTCGQYMRAVHAGSTCGQYMRVT